MKIDVLIIGAGLAGLSLAVGLERLGLTYAVVEKRQGADAPGAGILIHPSGIAALSSLGVELMESANFHTISEIYLGSPRNTAIVRQALGDDHYAVIGMRRSELHRVLCTKLRKPIFKFGCRIVRTVQGPVESVAELNDGTVFEANLIVDASGANSSLRTDIDCAERMRASSYVVWRWVVDHVIAPSTGYEVHEGRWRLGVFPINEHQSYVFMTVTGMKLAAAKQLRIEDLQAKVHAMGDVGAQIACPPLNASPLLRAIFEAPLRWQSDDGFTLIGDAAHPIMPNLGIGGSLAFEDSAILAAAMAGGNCTTTVAQLALRTRSSRIRSLALQSRLYGYSAYISGPWATDLKLHALSLVPDRIASSFQKRLYAGFYRSLQAN